MSDTPKWTKAIPNTDGYYWWRMITHPEFPEMLDIMHGYVRRGDDDGIPLSGYSNGEWLGPITPADLEELAALRAERAEATKIVGGNYAVAAFPIYLASVVAEYHDLGEQVERLRDAAQAAEEWIELSRNRDDLAPDAAAVITQLRAALKG